MDPTDSFSDFLNLPFLTYKMEIIMSSLKGGLAVKNPLTMQETRETRVWSLGWEDPLEEEMATHASILTWKPPWTEGAYRP